MASYDQVEHNDHVILIWLSAGILGLLGWSFFQGRYRSAARGGGVRELDAAATARVALNGARPRLTPSYLHWYGAPEADPCHRSHKVSYPKTPGAELERLIHGAPGACVTNSVPTSLRGWLFEPPAEVDY